MTTKLFESADRDEAHQFLAAYLEKHPGSPAECRDDWNVCLHSVWDGPVAADERAAGYKHGRDPAAEQPRQTLDDVITRAVSAAVAAALAAQTKGAA